MQGDTHLEKEPGDEGAQVGHQAKYPLGVEGRHRDEDQTLPLGEGVPATWHQGK